MVNPLMSCVALEDQLAHSLYDLLVAAGIPENSIILNPDVIQLCPDLEGPSGNVLVGNADIAADNWGFKFVAGIRYSLPQPLAPMHLKSVYLMTDATVSAMTPLLIGITLAQR